MSINIFKLLPNLVFALSLSTVNSYVQSLNAIKNVYQLEEILVVRLLSRGDTH